MLPLAWVMFVVALVNCPLSIFTYAKDEPPVILILSWAAIVYTAVDQIMSAKANKKLDN